MKKGILIPLAGALLAAAIAAIYSWAGSSVKAGLYPRVSISSGDKHIAYSYDGAIFLAKADGTEIKRLTSPESEDHVGPAFSPDGSKILFLSYPNPKKASKTFSVIYVMNSDGSDLKRVTSGEEHVLEAVFSADGAKIYFLQSGFYGNYSPVWRPGSHQVDAFSVNLDGTEKKNLTNYKAYGMSDLDASPDGKTLYLTLHDAPHSFRAVSLDDPNQMPALHRGRGWESGYRISPDNKWIVFHAISEKPLHKGQGYEYELFLINMETKKVRQLTSLGGCASDPAFFRDQPKILFARALNWPTRDRLRYELMRINLDGSQLEKIDITPPEASLNW